MKFEKTPKYDNDSIKPFLNLNRWNSAQNVFYSMKQNLLTLKHFSMKLQNFWTKSFSTSYKNKCIILTVSLDLYPELIKKPVLTLAQTKSLGKFKFVFFDCVTTFFRKHKYRIYFFVEKHEV